MNRIRQNMRAYNALLLAAESLQLPKRFTTDLTKHDKALIERYPGETFFWAVFADGTHMKIVGNSPEQRKPAIEFAFAVAETFPNARWFWWDGLALLERSDVHAIVEDIEASTRVIK